MKLVYVISLFVIGWSQNSNAAKEITKASTQLQSKSGSKVNGRVSFEKVSAGTLVRAEVKGLKPESTHGFHVHDKGDCSAQDAASAGDHFNPTKQAHGRATGEHRHMGDLENLVADKNGMAKYERTFPASDLSVASLVGRSVVVHEKADDLKTQPSGDSGARIGCGVIRD